VDSSSFTNSSPSFPALQAKAKPIARPDGFARGENSQLALKPIRPALRLKTKLLR